jgi:hypothetical protein
MAHPQVANGESLHMWKVAVNILNKLSITADKGRYFSLGVDQEANMSVPYNSMLRNDAQVLGVGLIL